MREIAQVPGLFCSHPSEISDEKMQRTLETEPGIYLVAKAAIGLSAWPFYLF